jgi:hypothetical protein
MMRPGLLKQRFVWVVLAGSAAALAAFSPSTSDALDSIAPAATGIEQVLLLCTVGEQGLSKNCRFDYPIDGDRERLKAGLELGFLDTHPFLIAGADQGSNVTLLVKLSVAAAPDGKGLQVAAPSGGLEPLIAIDDPLWVRSPHERWTGDYVPERAARMNQKGAAVVVCIATGKGELSDCRILNEEPKGFGFGEGAMRVLQHARMKALVAGRPYVQTLRYDGWGASPPKGPFNPAWAPG